MSESRVITEQPERLRVPPETYARVLEADPLGRQILEDLVARFHDVPIFTKGPDGARVTDFNLGARHVVQFILRRIGQIHEPDDT
jgi:hypothetical protein